MASAPERITVKVDVDTSPAVLRILGQERGFLVTMRNIIDADIRALQLKREAVSARLAELDEIQDQVT